jgi:hypothetical protein
MDEAERTRVRELNVARLKAWSARAQPVLQKLIEAFEADEPEGQWQMMMLFNQSLQDYLDIVHNLTLTPEEKRALAEEEWLGGSDGSPGPGKSH